jgi:hypothetical protein
MTTETLQYKSDRPLTLKTGAVIPAGTLFNVLFNCTAFAQLNPAGTLDTYRVRCASLPRYFDAFEKPSLDELDDSICPSITGESVEPDGFDEYGAPSWLIALGLI